MRRILTLIKRIIKEMRRDKRTLAIMLLAPLMVLTLMKVVFDNSDKANFTIGTENLSQNVQDNLMGKNITLKTYTNTANIKQVVQKDHLDAFLAQKADHYTLTYLNADPSKTQQIRQFVANALKKEQMSTLLEKTGEKGFPAQALKEQYVYGNKNSTYFEKIFPVLMGFFVFFFVFLISGIALLRERENGTLERMLATPIKRAEIVLGYLLGYGIFAILQTIFIVLFSIWILNIRITGNLPTLFFSNILLAFVALSIGIFCSTFATSEFQMVQFIPIVVVPQVFFSGILPLESMANFLQKISYLFPLRYAGKILSSVMLTGGTFLENVWHIAILGLFLTFFSLLNVLGLRRYRKV